MLGILWAKKTVPLRLEPYARHIPLDAWIAGDRGWVPHTGPPPATTGFEAVPAPAKIPPIPIGQRGSYWSPSSGSPVSSARPRRAGHRRKWPARCPKRVGLPNPSSATPTSGTQGRRNSSPTSPLGRPIHPDHPPACCGRRPHRHDRRSPGLRPPHPGRTLRAVPSSPPTSNPPSS